MTFSWRDISNTTESGGRWIAHEFRGMRADNSAVTLLSPQWGYLAAGKRPLSFQIAQSMQGSRKDKGRQQGFVANYQWIKTLCRRAEQVSAVVFSGRTVTQPPLAAREGGQARNQLGPYDGLEDGDWWSGSSPISSPNELWVLTAGKSGLEMAFE